MIPFPPLTRGVIQRRYKRFLADVELPDGEVVVAHCPNPGSMKSCWEPGWGAWLSHSDNPKRKLKWTLEMLEAPEGLILVNTQRPNGVVEAGIRAGLVEELRGYEGLRREVRYGEKSRVDLLLEHEGRPPCYVEVKSVTLSLGGGLGAFPDSVTKRGAKHLRDLAAEVQRGNRAVMFFLAPREGVRAVRVAHEIDPTYAAELKRAMAAGVEVIVHAAELSPEGVNLGGALQFIEEFGIEELGL